MYFVYFRLVSPPPLQTGDSQLLHNHLQAQRPKRTTGGGNSGNRTPKSMSGTPNELHSLSPINNVGGDRLNNNNLGGGGIYDPVSFGQPIAAATPSFSSNFIANVSTGYNILLHTFQYLKVQVSGGCLKQRLCILLIIYLSFIKFRNFCEPVVCVAFGMRLLNIHPFGQRFA